MLSVKKYIKEVVDEGRKIIFPVRKDVYITSLYIVTVMIFAAVSISLVDFAISHVIRIIFGMGN